MVVGYIDASKHFTYIYKLVYSAYYGDEFNVSFIYIT